MRVLLADDHRLLLEGLANLLDAHGIQVAGMAHDGLEAVALARSLRPDVILMDIRMPRCDGLCATRLIKAEMPDVKIVILTTSEEDQDLFDTVRSGACGYLLKSMDADELVAALRQAEVGIPPFAPGLAVKILNEFAQRGRPEVKPEAHLTGRQRQVLEMVAEGLSYKEIGARLSLSPRTIKYHMAEIMQLLHLDHRAQVLAYAGRIGMGTDSKEE
jgi:DNA-binding NarL/FixJ family response regulator